MQKRKKGYTSVAIATTTAVVDSDGSDSSSDTDGSDVDASTRIQTGPANVTLNLNSSSNDFADEDSDSGLDDDEELNEQLEYEVGKIIKMNDQLDTKQRQSRWCLVRCFCGTKNSRTISVWFFTFLIFGVVEIVGSIKVSTGILTFHSLLMLGR